jgi:GNAT superfamily N-acetyltransferase
MIMAGDQVKVRPLIESELEDADRIMRTAFGTFFGLPDPTTFMGDACYVRSRWKASPASAFAAEVDGRLAGSNFATRWGSFGFFGPLSLDPTFWDRGIASTLMEPVIESLDTWGVTHAGLFTFAQSPKHIGLYQKFGFRPRSLTLLLERPVRMTDVQSEGWSTYSELDEYQRSEALSACQHLTDGIYPGLDVTPEVESIEKQSLGETILIADLNLLGFATCHIGRGSEAGSGVCYIKFGAAAPGPSAREHFRRLLEACEVFAAGAGATRIVAGVNAARAEAYEEMLLAGFRISFTGISMHRSNEPGFSRPGVFVIDDWR